MLPTALLGFKESIGLTKFILQYINCVFRCQLCSGKLKIQQRQQWTLPLLHPPWVSLTATQFSQILRNLKRWFTLIHLEHFPACQVFTPTATGLPHACCFARPQDLLWCGISPHYWSHTCRTLFQFQACARTIEADCFRVSLLAPIGGHITVMVDWVDYCRV